MLGCTFLPGLISWLNTYFLSSWCLFFQKVAKIWNFWKVAINFCHTVKPLWVSSRLVSRSKLIYINKTMCCGVAAIVLSDSAAYLTGYVASTAAPKKNKKTCRHKNRCPWWASTAPKNLWRNYVGTSVWSSLPCTCSIRRSTQRTKEIDTFNPSTKPR